MAWRTVVISNPAKLRIENSQLVIVQDESIPLPLEDIGVLLIESPEVLLSSSLLYRAAQAGTVVIVCDDKHLPCMAALPLDGHSRLAGVHRMQLSLTIPFLKRCWQAVIRCKIANQARCVEIIGYEDPAPLRVLIPRVASGDSTNVEARAARLHFELLFDDDFLRGDDTSINAALNYGYAIMRATVARALVSYGFLLSLGIHHRSELNPFNLADDFIEPFRPVVDLYVAKNVSEITGFHIGHRRDLVSLLAAEVLIDGKRHSVNRAAEIMASSFVTACREKSAAALKLPELLALHEHEYE